MRVAFFTLGCKVNQYETEAMREAFERAGHTAVPASEPADAYVVNTCAVTAVSAGKSRQMVSKAHSASPNAVIAVVGCYAQVSPDEVNALDGVNVVIGSQDKRDVVRLVEGAVADRRRVSVVKERISNDYEGLAASCGENTRAYVKIQDGCDNFCSYCIIPYARGRKRSRPLDDVREELCKLEQNGFREVVLTGIHLLSYGDDLADGSTLIDVLRLASSFDGIKRIRLGSLDASRMTDGLIAAIADCPKVCRQFHLSLQSGSDAVLKRMNRRYTAAEYRAVVAALRDAMPDCAITTDMIAGFPMETEAEHCESVAFAREIGFSKIHVFPYSRRRGTVADRLDGQVPNEVKSRRAHELLRLTEELERSFAEKLIGSEAEVLIEEASSDGSMTGFTDTYVRAYVASPSLASGELIRVRITGLMRHGVAASADLE